MFILVGGRKLVFSPSRSDLVVQRSRWCGVKLSARSTIWAWFRGLFFKKLKENDGFLYFLGSKKWKKNENLNEICQILVSGGLDGWKWMREAGPDRFLDSPASKTLKKPNFFFFVGWFSRGFSQKRAESTYKRLAPIYTSIKRIDADGHADGVGRANGYAHKFGRALRLS